MGWQALSQVKTPRRSIPQWWVPSCWGSFLTGVLFLILGRFKLSGFARYVSHPVVRGFLAGTRYLLVKGTFGVLVNTSLSFANVAMFFEHGHFMELATGNFIWACTIFHPAAFQPFSNSAGVSHPCNDLVLCVSLRFGYFHETGGRAWLAVRSFP